MEQFKLPKPHPWVRKKKSKYHYVACVWGTILFASAYLVYNNAAAHLPIAVSYFWFSLFALLATFLYPKDLSSAVLYTDVQLRKKCGTGISPRFIRWKLLYARSPWRQFWDQKKRVEREKTEKEISAIKKALCQFILCSVVGFVALLASLRGKGVVITVLMLQQIQPLLGTYVGWKITKTHTVESVVWYTAGSVAAALGILLYKDVVHAESVRFFDAVFWFSLVYILTTSVGIALRAKFRDLTKVDGLHASQALQIGATCIGFCWMIGWMFARKTAFIPSMGEFAALCYLGFVPTAFGNIIHMRVQDKTSLGTTHAIGSLRPIFVVLLGCIPIFWFKVNTVLTFMQWLGIAIAIGGVFLAVKLGKPSIVKPAETEREEPTVTI